MHVGQPVAAALVLEDELFVVDSQLVQNRRLEVMHVDRIDLEVLPANAGAAAFWRKIGFVTVGRTIWSKDLG